MLVRKLAPPPIAALPRTSPAHRAGVEPVTGAAGLDPLAAHDIAMIAAGLLQLSDAALLAIAIRDCPLPEPARATLRLAKCIELLCATFAGIHGAGLLPAAGTGALSERDAARLAAARRLVDEHWQEKLTLDGIARACGLNRAKLTRGFRQTFGSTVADAITDRRLQGAHRLLLATDLPVSSIGYRCGYSNNASFTRAFSRRYGVAPTRLRAMEIAA